MKAPVFVFITMLLMLPVERKLVRCLVRGGEVRSFLSSFFFSFLWLHVNPWTALEKRSFPVGLEDLDEGYCYQEELKHWPPD